jgi:hypothetical protein
MRNCCTVCHGRLHIWQRVWGRVDHPSCRSKSMEKKPVPRASYAKSPVTTIRITPGGELGIGFSNPPPATIGATARFLPRIAYLRRLSRRTVTKKPKQRASQPRHGVGLQYRKRNEQRRLTTRQAADLTNRGPPYLLT